jgi:hypothetical protein
MRSRHLETSYSEVLVKAGTSDTSNRGSLSADWGLGFSSLSSIFVRIFRIRLIN